MTFFEQSRYFFNYILPDIISSNLIQINHFLSQFWWIFFIIDLILLFISLKIFRKKTKLLFEFEEFDKFLDDLSSKNDIKDVEDFILKSVELFKAKYSALYELRGETYILLESNAISATDIALPLRIGKKELKRFKKSGNYMVKYFISRSKNSLILYFTLRDFEPEKYYGYINIILSFYEKISLHFKEMGERALLDINKDTYQSLLKLQMDKYQFFKFFVELIVKVTKARNARLLTKDNKMIFEHKKIKNASLQKVFYIRNTPYKLEFYDDKPLSMQKIAQIGSFLDMAGSFLMNIDRESEMVQNYLSFLKFTNQAIELESKYYKNHSLIVQTVSVELAKSLFLSEQEIDNISLGAYLHDIGMIGDLLSIVNKEKFEKKDMDLIKEHPIIGSIIVEPICHIYPIENIIKYHHERFDGKGYPFGLKEAQIPLDAQIVAFGEFYAGITSDRPYRKGKSHEEAVAEIKNLREKMFSSVIVDAFLDIQGPIKIKIEKIKMKRFEDQDERKGSKQ